MRILILESGGSRGALAAVRSLGAAGHQVDVGQGGRHSLASRSSAVHEAVPLPALERDLHAYLDAVDRRLREVPYDAVMGAGDAEVLALVCAGSRFGPPVLHPPASVVRSVLDKQCVHQAAEAERVGAPSAALFTDTHDLRARLREGPVVVKPRLHWDVGSDARPLRTEAQVARTEAQALRMVEDIRQSQGEAVLQDFVVGNLMSYVVLLDDEARVVAQCQQRTVHAYPEPMGVSARAVTEPVDVRVADDSLRVLTRLRLTGLVQVQYIYDPGRRRRLLIDVNPRIYGSIQLAVSAGVDFPRLWVEAAAGRRPSSPPVTARAGVQYQWLEGDLRRSLARRSVRELVGCLTAAPRSTHSTLSLHDPSPALAQGRELGRRLASRVRAS